MIWNSKTWIDWINQQLLFIKISHKIDICYFVYRHYNVYGYYILYMCPHQCIALQGYGDNFHIFIIGITGLYTDKNKMHIVYLELLEIHCLQTLQIFGNEKVAAMDMAQLEYGWCPDQTMSFGCCYIMKLGWYKCALHQLIWSKSKMYRNA